MRHLLDAEFCTGGPHPIEHIGCGLKMGERITLPLIGRVTPILPDAEVGVGIFLTTLQLMLIVKVVKIFVYKYYCKFLIL